MGAVAELFKRASELSDEERATLAGLLIESLETEMDSNVEQAWAAEVERRLAELDSGAVRTIPWEAVRAKLHERLGKP
jgi:putative addiction module component (TIGR02574 family)